MRKLMVLVVAAVLCAGVMPARAEANHTLAHKVKLLETKVERLSAFVNSCIAWRVVPIGWYGNPEGQSGYVFQQAGQTFVTTALDLAPARDAAFFVPALRPACRATVGPLARAPMLAARAFAPSALPFP